MLKGLLQALAALFVLMFLISSCSDGPGEKTTAPSAQEASTSEVASAASAAVEPPLPAAPPEPVSPWTYVQDDDPMGRGVIKQASTESLNYVSFGFPYQGPQAAKLYLRKHPQHGRDVILVIERGQFLCSSFDGCSVLVRFGEGKPQRFSATGPADHSSTQLFISGHDKFVAQAKKVSKIAIQAQFYQEGNHVFEFDVTGLKW